MTSNIKLIIEKYIKVDDELKILNKEATQLRNEKKQIGEQISDYLKANSNEKDALIEVGKNSFKMIKYTKKRVNKDLFESVLKNRINDDNRVIKIMEEVVEENEECYLKRSIKK